jgi:5-methylcytosine-specific restriction enzyme subunit McrC
MNQSPPRTVFLRERTPATCRLAPEDIDFLLAEHASHIALQPTARRHRYRLTPGHHVGTIVGPSCRLVIHPKIPVSNLFGLLDPLASVAGVADQAEAVPGAEALDFLAGRLAHLLTERAAAGLHRDYAERAETGPFLQGRLDVASHVREPAARKDRLHCRFEDFTADVPCNQVPRATGDLVLRCPLLGEGVRAALRRTLAPYAEVTSIPLQPESFSAALPDTATPHLRTAYRPLLDVCRLLAEGLSPDEAAGSLSFPAFLLDMEKVFECYVTRAVDAAFAGSDRFTVAVQRSFVASRPAPGRPGLLMRPDLTVERDGRPWLVVDAKWKDLESTALEPDDVYQILAYATALGINRAVLVYPGRRSSTWEYPLAHGAFVLANHTLRVFGSTIACACSCRRLGQALKRET